MLRRTMAEIDIKNNLKTIWTRINETYERRPKDILGKKPNLIAVSKIKPADLVIQAYDAGQRHFGENYVQELVEKSKNPDILEKCPDIKWHFIGHLQSNKVNKVASVPNLHMVESVDSAKLANTLNQAWEKVESPNKLPLRVLLQINSSGEEVKSGTSAEEATTLYRHIQENLKNLQVCGIMTIGAYGFDYSQGPNPDFIKLMEVKKIICDEFNIDPMEIEVSMGMSGDYDKAIEMGSTMVRVGTAIFGDRPTKH